MSEDAHSQSTGGHLVPPVLAAELEKLYPWQERMFWAMLAESGPIVLHHGRRNGLATVRRLVRAWAEKI